jgi:hypothetical protein
LFLARLNTFCCSWEYSNRRLFCHRFSSDSTQTVPSGSRNRRVLDFCVKLWKFISTSKTNLLDKFELSPNISLKIFLPFVKPLGLTCINLSFRRRRMACAALKRPLDLDPFEVLHSPNRPPNKRRRCTPIKALDRLGFIVLFYFKLL